MTNEELAVRIKEGDRALTGELWEQVKGFVYKQAYAFANRYHARCCNLGLEPDDLFQEGYFAIERACTAFDPAKGCTFLTYAGFHLKSRFFTVAKMHFTGWQNNTVYQASSLDELRVNKEGCAYYPLDLLIDTSSLTAINAITEDDWHEGLRQTLESSMSSLIERQAYILRKRYCEGVRPVDLARELGVTRPVVGASSKRALAKLNAQEQIRQYGREACLYA